MLPLRSAALVGYASSDEDVEDDQTNGGGVPMCELDSSRSMLLQEPENGVTSYCCCIFLRPEEVALFPHTRKTMAKSSPNQNQNPITDTETDMDMGIGMDNGELLTTMTQQQQQQNPGADNKYAETIQIRIENLSRMGALIGKESFTEHLAAASYHYPGVLRRTFRKMGVFEYATKFPKSIYDPLYYSKSSFTAKDSAPRPSEVLPANGRRAETEAPGERNRT